MTDPLSRIDKRLEEALGIGPNAQAEKDARLVRRATRQKLVKDRDENREDNKEDLAGGSAVDKLAQKLADELQDDQ